MSSFYNYSPGTGTHAQYLKRVITTNQDGDRFFDELMAMMTQMLDGDGSADAHFATIQVRFGFDSVAVARAAYNELSSAYSKTRGNDAVDHVRDARQQLYARLTV